MSLQEPPQFSRAFEADGAIGEDERVKLDSDGKITQAGLADFGIGTAMREAFAAGDVISVALYGPIRKHKAIEALDAGAVVYTESAGKVQDTAQATAFPIGIALEAATADGDIIDVMMITQPAAAA